MDDTKGIQLTKMMPIISKASPLNKCREKIEGQLMLNWKMSISVCNQPPRPTQPPTLSRMENKYRLLMLCGWE